MGTTMLIRIGEGRTVAEPTFPLLLSIEAGAIAGFVAGYYGARASADARRARRVNDALTFTNELIRHDLRNDMSAIMGYGELLAAELDDDRADAIVRKTDDAVERIETTRVVTEALVGDPDLEPVDLVEIAGAAVRQLEDTTAATVRTDFPDRAVVAANAGLRSVLDNLLENAVEHTDAAEPAVTVRIQRDHDDVRLTVEDDGPGIPDEHVERLETPSRAGSETGGLSLVATLVEAYGGTIHVRRGDGRGTAVTIRFPAVTEHDGRA
jgi:signal transduction histidine kinase